MPQSLYSVHFQNKKQWKMFIYSPPEQIRHHIDQIKPNKLMTYGRIWNRLLDMVSGNVIRDCVTVTLDIFLNMHRVILHQQDIYDFLYYTCQIYNEWGGKSSLITIHYDRRNPLIPH